MLNNLLMASETSTAPTAEWATQTASALQGLHVESVLLPLLWQVALIILVARVFATVFRWMGQPGTVGEIAAGLLIGPSVLGKLAPDLFQSIFHPALEGVPLVVSDQLFRWILTAFSQFGLILLLFLVVPRTNP